MESGNLAPALIRELRSLRLNVLPPYTIDHDEGELSAQEYVTYYCSRFSQSIAATDDYISRLDSLLHDRESMNAFDQYLQARVCLIENTPFCEDTFPPASSRDYVSAYELLRNVFTRHERGQFSGQDLEMLHHYRSILASLADHIE